MYRLLVVEPHLREADLDRLAFPRHFIAASCCRVTTGGKIGEGVSMLSHKLLNADPVSRSEGRGGGDLYRERDTELLITSLPSPTFKTEWLRTIGLPPWAIIKNSSTNIKND